MSVETAAQNVHKWIEENRQFFSPPVCNKCMFNDQLTVFFVGGPNERNDYHIEEGEELFLQVQGDMCLKVVEGGKFKDVIIKEGEIFLLPARIQHSPQRFENTVGLVVERRRNLNEKDAVRYFVKDSSEVLFERWFHLKDIVKDLPPLIKEYFASDAHKTGRPTADSVVIENRVFDPDLQTMLEQPFSLKEWLDNNAQQIRENGAQQIFGAPRYKTQVLVYGMGDHQVSTYPGETLVWQERGKSTITVDGKKFALGPCEVARVSENQNFSITSQDAESFTLTVRMKTP